MYFRIVLKSGAAARLGYFLDPEDKSKSAQRFCDAQPRAPAEAAFAPLCAMDILCVQFFSGVFSSTARGRGSQPRTALRTIQREFFFCLSVFFYLYPPAALKCASALIFVFKALSSCSPQINQKMRCGALGRAPHFFFFFSQH